jgi:NAD(P)-dependent dehydrogenase (short-subunit alcohol dehydrogenase family)
MSAQRFQGKVAVVTGGNSGIGLGVANAYAHEGAQVAITGRNEKTLEEAAKEIGDGTLAIQSHAGKVAEIEAAMKKIEQRFGRIDALFVNAGVAKLVPFEQVTEQLFDETVDINMKGMFFYRSESDPANVQRPSSSTRRSTRTWACRGLRYTARPKRVWSTWPRRSRQSSWKKGFA